MPVISRDGEIISGSEISFLSKDEETYPQLTRLFFDFDFRIVAIPSSGDSPDTRYLITFASPATESQRTAVTPAFASLAELEAYTDQHVIEILHETLFSQSDDDA
jgi:hypothetical protein